MSLVSSVVEIVKPQSVPPSKAPSIDGKLKAAERVLAELEGRHGEAALRAVEGADGAQERLADVEADILAARRQISTLRAAHAEAVKRDEADERRKLAAIHKAQIKTATAHLRARDAAAEALSVAIAEACAQFRILTERSEKAMAANPIGGSWPAGSVCTFSELRRLVEGELFKHGGDPTIGNPRSFPGAVVHDSRFTQNPSGIRPLAEAVREASDHVINTLTGKAPAAE